MEKLYEEGRIVFSETMRPRVKRYADKLKGHVVGCIWDDIPPIQSISSERRGYPTQKPLPLLERIIAVSSKEGDVVLDPFCGCGTAIVAADRMNRKWIGVDITYLAIAEVEFRLAAETHAQRGKTYKIEGSPKDAYSAVKFFESTAAQNHKPFEMWAVSLIQGEPMQKKGGDKGIDGRIPLYDTKKKLRWAVIQVKGGNINPGFIRDFAHVIEREKALFGIFICLQEPTKKVKEAAEDAGFVTDFGTRHIPRLQILTIRELLEEGRQVDLPAGYRELRHQGLGKPVHKTVALDFSGDDVLDFDEEEE